MKTENREPMYTLFKKHTNRLIVNYEGSNNSRSMIRRYQDHLVQNLNKSTSKISKGCLVFSMSLFVIVTASIYVCIVLKSFSKTTSNTIPINVISKPNDVFKDSMDTHINTSDTRLLDRLICIENYYKSNLKD